MSVYLKQTCINLKKNDTRQMKKIQSNVFNFAYSEEILQVYAVIQVSNFPFNEYIPMNYALFSYR